MTSPSPQYTDPNQNRKASISFLSIILIIVFFIVGLGLGYSFALSQNTQEQVISTPTPTVTTTPEQVDLVTVQLYYYNRAADSELTLSEEFVTAVDRKLPESDRIIEDTLELLLKGEITETEGAAGFETEFPLEGVELRGISLKDGVLTIDLADPNNKTMGGASRVNLLRAQVEKTALQFESVESVEFTSESLFQP